MYVDVLFLSVLVGVALLTAAAVPVLLIYFLIKDIRRNKLW